MYLIKVTAKKSSIHGKGCFTLEDIKSDDIVWKFDPNHDRTLTRAEFDALSDKNKKEIRRVAYISKHTNRWVYPPANDPALFTNHSKENNLSAVFNDSISEEPFFVANRDIKAGEELTNNYTEFDDLTTDPEAEQFK